jgi:glucoamylase
LPLRFRLHWSVDEWATVQDTQSSNTILGIEYADIPIAALQADPWPANIRFTFFRTATESWEGRDYVVQIV